MSFSWVTITWANQERQGFLAKAKSGGLPQQRRITAALPMYRIL
jgi:hypothetical protein